MNLDEIYAFLRYNQALRGLVAGLAISGLWLGFWAYSGLPVWRKIAVWFLAGTMALAGTAACAGAAATNLRQPRDWDFLCFWTFARVMHEGSSPYEKQLLEAAALPHQPSESFQTLNYCLYPPTSVVLFYPLGYFDLKWAMAGWYLLQFGAFALAIWLLYDHFDPARRRLGLLVTIASATSLFGAIYTFYYAQTTPLILLAMLLSQRSPRWGGWWLGCAAVVKPIGAIFCLDFILRRDWRQLCLMFVAPVLAGMLFVGLQGTAGVQTWLQRNPLPDGLGRSIFIEEMNQSLLAVTHRIAQQQPGSQPLLYPPFVVLGGLLMLISLTVLIRLTLQKGSGAAPYLLALGLLIYPGTLIHYGIFLLFPLAVLTRKAQNLLGRNTAVHLLWGLVFGLTWMRAAFAANLVLWLFLTIQLTWSPNCLGEISQSESKPPG